MKSLTTISLLLCLMLAVPAEAAPKHTPSADKKTAARKSDATPAPAPVAGTALAGVTPPLLAARSWLLLDTGSNQVLASLRPDERAEPASLTKLMTAYVVFGALRAKSIKLDQQVPVSENAWRMVKSGSAMFIEPRKPLTVDEAIHGVIIQSGNDACVALAELVAGSEQNFVTLMNREAKRLGLTNTQFRNATGLTEDGHYSTPRDMGKIAAAIIRDFPEYFPIYSQKQFSYNKITQPNRNRLLWLDPTVDGMKTGHTDAAGFCLVATAHRGPRRLISVVMGTASDSVRAEESQKLLNFGFIAYDTVRFFASGQPMRSLQVWQGKTDTVPVGFTSDVTASVPKDRANDVKLQFESRQPLKAPLPFGTAVGTLRMTLDGQALGDFPAVTLEDVAQANWFGRTWDAMRLWFK
ncbi:D-alanyl-D-alanine carboxypeptidase family protein [Uliginosibacterium sp. H3]|uniref:serine-type D-Ala-D-Ala carboxypeptidase n=1 Tax=Uliginosibacterium silvisoli TaxID=3114758 RepID=A0ABU6K026_9RHOO|nr:D-alanyl-D-alanine carboxypeptidase family protein [Uliginosibacterium sp. H3]